MVSTVFHKGRKVLRQAIGNHNYAEIADLLYFRITGSKYCDKKGNPFFLLPNINHIVEETGFCERLCQRALSELEKNDWIRKIKTRCFDGAVRIRIYITKKFIEIMHYIESMVDNKTCTLSPKTSNKALKNADYAQMAESDSADLADSYIKEEKKKEDNKVNNKKKSENVESKKLKNTKSVNFKFSLNLEKYTKEMELFIKDTAKKEQINANKLLMTLVDLEESGLYENQEKMIQDAIQSLKRIEGGKKNLPKGGDKKIKPKQATFKAEDKRMNYLTPLQQIAIIENLKYLEKTKRTCLGSIKEVFCWVEFQLTNPEYHFQGKGFKHSLNIIKKMLCNKGKRQYSRPYGYGSRFNK